MGYTALYRKFRPTKFSEIVGQEHIKRTLKNQIIFNRVGHAYLFNGGRGTGKTSTAKILARAVNCLNVVDGEPCNECEICKAAISGSLTDIIEMDAASNNSVEDIRSIREAVNFLPTKAKYRVYIIDEVHMLSTGAFNALLKTLEEPPEHVKFILATTEPQKLPATILSRCQRFDFKRISNDDIKKGLKTVCDKSKIEITEDALNLIAVLSEGGMRDALSILERCNQDGAEKINVDRIKELIGIPKLTFINELINTVIDSDVEKALEVINRILENGNDINNLVWELIKYVKDILLYKTTNKTELYNEFEIEEIRKISDKLTKQELINLICKLSEIENEIKLSTQKTIILQAEIIKLCNKSSSDSVNSSNSMQQNNNSNLEERVTKIENFLKAGNFSKKLQTNDDKDKFTQKNEKNISNFKKVENGITKIDGKLQDYWPKLVNNFKEQGKMFMYINLSGSVAKEINDMTLAIEFPNGINKVAKDFLERPDNKQILKETVHIASGKEMQIKYIDTNQNKKISVESEFQNFAKNEDLPFNII